MVSRNAAKNNFFARLIKSFDLEFHMTSEEIRIWWLLMSVFLIKVTKCLCVCTKLFQFFCLHYVYALWFFFDVLIQCHSLHYSEVFLQTLSTIVSFIFLFILAFTEFTINEFLTTVFACVFSK